MCVYVSVSVCVYTHPHATTQVEWCQRHGSPRLQVWKTHTLPMAFFYLSQALPVACVESTTQETTLLGLQGDQISQSKKKSVLIIHWKDWCWSWSSNTLATWCEELTHWKRPWCWERLKAGGEVDDTGWDDGKASPTWWTCVSASSGSWWWIGKPGMLQFKQIAKNWTRLSNWTELSLPEAGTEVGAFISFLCN